MRVIAAGIAGSILLSSGASDIATAKTVELLRSGYWTAFGGTTGDATPVCGVMASSEQGRVFAVMWFKGDDHLTIQLFKPAWTVPTGMQVDIAIRFDDAAPWNAKAVGMGNLSTGGGIEFKVPMANVDKFSSELRYANTMTLWFLTGTEAPWTGDLRGSDGAVSMMTNCIQDVNKQDRAGSTKPSVGNARPDGQGASQPRVPKPSTPAPSSQAVPIGSLRPSDRSI